MLYLKMVFLHLCKTTNAKIKRRICRYYKATYCKFANRSYEKSVIYWK